MRIKEKIILYRSPELRPYHLMLFSVETRTLFFICLEGLCFLQGYRPSIPSPNEKTTKLVYEIKSSYNKKRVINNPFLVIRAFGYDNFTFSRKHFPIFVGASICPSHITFLTNKCLPDRRIYLSHNKFINISRLETLKSSQIYYNIWDIALILRDK